MRMVRAGLMPSAAAAACSDVVLNGAGGRWVRLFLTTSVTVPVVAPSTCEKAVSAASRSVKRPFACEILNASSSPAPAGRASPPMTQKSSGLNARRSRSRSTTSARVGVCTRPAERTLPKPPNFAMVR